MLHFLYSYLTGVLGAFLPPVPADAKALEPDIKESRNYMRNVAFSPEYANQYKQQSEILFRPENKRTKEEGCFANGYFLLCETYEGELDGEPRMAARYSLFTPNHDLVLSYDCLDNEHALSEMIKHNNGIVYYVFRRDRFGFSVFNLATLTEHRYYSDEAFKTAPTSSGAAPNTIRTEILFLSSDTCRARLSRSMNSTSPTR